MVQSRWYIVYGIYLQVPGGPFRGDVDWAFLGLDFKQLGLKVLGSLLKGPYKALEPREGEPGQPKNDY